MLTESFMIDTLALTGRSSAHVVPISGTESRFQPKVAEDFVAMRLAAAKDGIDLVAVSSWRDFARQRAIWNAKFKLEKPLRNNIGEIIDGRSLDARSRLEAIMRWSAMPGASRHHWGTDCDVYDRAVADANTLQLVPEEYSASGPFGRLHDWLQHNMHRFGFYQPYRTDRGGVCPEPWHLSHALTAQHCERLLDCGVLLELLRQTTTDDEQRIEGHELLCEHLVEWHARYIAAVDPPPSSAFLRA